MAGKTYDAAVIGAGVFGAWTARSLRRAGLSVALLDAHGAGNARASSGGESRIIRAGYGGDEIYTRWAARALDLWREFAARTGQPLFHRTGVLWMARDADAYTLATEATLARVGVRFEKLTRGELERRWPQIEFGPVTWALYEPEGGALMARRAVQGVVEDAVASGVEYFTAAALPPASAAARAQGGRIEAVATRGGGKIGAGVFVFACGPWLPQLFPELLGGRIHPTRQEVYFFGTPPGDARFAPPLAPAWIDFGAEVYGIPDLEARGFKLALDRHGPAFDPEADERTVSGETLAAARAYLAERFPALAAAPLVEARVCQYENTSSGDFLIDRHPEMENVWLVGGGSGHGFKHGPALGEYVAARVTGGGGVEPRFTMTTKEQVRRRSVY
jgi:sarcosine oxidase